jgi:hypothetical protein
MSSVSAGGAGGRSAVPSAAAVAHTPALNDSGMSWKFSDDVNEG